MKGYIHGTVRRQILPEYLMICIEGAIPNKYYKEVVGIMKTRRMTKVAAAALAMAMCVPCSALASGTTTPVQTSGSFTTSFDVYSPKLTIQVPVNLDIEVNPLVDSTATGVKKFTVASNSIDIWNASVDTAADSGKGVGIPVNVTVKATIAEKKADVMTEYNTFTTDVTATTKRINLMLSEAQTAATLKLKNGQTAEFEGADNKVLKLSQWETNAEAVYTTPAQSVAITKYGSLLSVDIAKPTTSDSTGGFTADATKVTATVGSFAVTGVANVSADWKADDVKVNVTYDVKASAARNIATPAIATAPTFTSGASAADMTVVIPNVGEAKVVAVGCHNDGKGLYGDYVWDAKAYTVTYAPNASQATQTDATIKFPKTDAGLATFLAGDDYKGKKQDFVVGLSDGRMVVSTLTVN